MISIGRMTMGVAVGSVALLILVAASAADSVPAWLVVLAIVLPPPAIIGWAWRSSRLHLTPGRANS